MINPWRGVCSYYHYVELKKVFRGKILLQHFFIVYCYECYQHWHKFLKGMNFFDGCQCNQQGIQLFHHIRNCQVAVFLCTAFLEYTPVILNSLSYLTLKNLIIAYLSEGCRMNEIFVFVKCRTLNLTLSHLSPPSWAFWNLQNSLEFS